MCACVWLNAYAYVYALHVFAVARIMYDGGARGNPGRSGAGAVLLDGDTNVVLGANDIHAQSNAHPRCYLFLCVCGRV